MRDSGETCLIPASLEATGSGRTDALADCLRDGRSWRNLRLLPKSAFSSFPPIHRADLKGQQRVQAVRKLLRVFARTYFVRFFEPSSKKIVKNFALLGQPQKIAVFSHSLGRLRASKHRSKRCQVSGSGRRERLPLHPSLGQHPTAFAGSSCIGVSTRGDTPAASAIAVGLASCVSSPDCALSKDG
jgi:hypothetical protein